MRFRIKNILLGQYFTNSFFMNRIYTLLWVALLFMAIPHAKGQSIGPSTINAAGGYATLSGNEYEWSIGEMTMVSTFSTSAIVVTQGVLQPAFGSLDVKTTQNLTDGLLVFPNPANTTVNIQYTATDNGKLNYRLMDVVGRVILSDSKDLKIGVNTLPLNIANLAEGTYLLEVTCDIHNISGQTMSYKIQKLN